MIRLLFTAYPGALSRDRKFSMDKLIAFVQARDKLLPEVMEYIFYEFSKSLPAPKTFKGKRLLAVDGSTFAMVNHYMPQFV